MPFCILLEYQVNVVRADRNIIKYILINSVTARYLNFMKASCFKDTDREKAPSNKTHTLTKSMNMDIWVVIISTLYKMFLN